MKLTNLYIISFDQNNQKIINLLQNQDNLVVFNYDKNMHNLDKFIAQGFQQADLILFICASGIAIRKVAPFIVNKALDPAILLLDPTHHYLISLLSGHLGNANTYTKELASLINATPIITTATDHQQVFAIDTFALNNNLDLQSLKMIKEVATITLNNQPLAFETNLDLENNPSFKLDQNASIKIVVTNDTNKKEQENEVVLKTKDYVVGMGLRKDKDFQSLEKAFLNILEQANLKAWQVRAITTIDLKNKEKGLWQLVQKYQLQLYSYNYEILNTIKGEFSSSDFVKSITQTDNVCERSLKAYDQNIEIIIHKQKDNGITTALGYSPITKIKF